MKHGLSKSRLYRIWSGMRSRCGDQSNVDYGGRGITVCHEWNEFLPFHEWAVANGYSDDLSIDRKDNNGGYNPVNCRWATHKEQVHNRRYGPVVPRVVVSFSMPKFLDDFAHARCKALGFTFSGYIAWLIRCDAGLIQPDYQI